MAFQTVFKRYELKYMLTSEQKQRILEAIIPHMKPDPYGKTTIRNLYFDTDSYLLIRRTIEKPVYREKLRIRSYCKAYADSTVFVELKKKYKHVVYKRRISLPESEAMKWLSAQKYTDNHTQIANEIDYFMKLYGTLHPTVFLSYEREAYYANDNSGFRVTFDDNILCRQEDLSLQSDAYGTPILPRGKVLMELKCSGGIPLWMASVLSKEKIYKTAFSKYGTAYRTIIFPQTHTMNPYNMLEVAANA
ncbi:MAG: polyphosphate polymerase domain-containing protein [Ruminococcaceae bacterium]|nr:polyphosphate polymerase domain-containing protein [Oscillospiraceae bacterium]MBQ9938992.1 polyphosphate polymerase domain-containing protein [Oscillospiraceae bacterium]